MTVCVRTALRAMGYVCLLAYAAHGTPEEGGFSDLSVRILRCGYVESPLATGTPRPRLGWQLAGERIGARQTAYQLQSAWTREDLEASRATWDTGRMASDQSQQVRFDGPPPEPRQRTWWRVRAWDEAGLPTPWSDPAWFETGALSMADWGASWVEAPPRQADQPEAAPLFRKEFAVAGPVRQARAYVCGLGYHELYLNGMKVGDGVLEPAQTDYPKRALYVAHDITGLLHPGENAVGLWVGDGWYDQSRMYGNMSYGEPCAIALLEWVLEDGAVTRVVTDGSWKAGWGPVLENNVHLGEVYDARLEVPRWASPGFDDSAWPDAVVRPSPTESLEPQRMPGIRRVEELPARAVTQPAEGVYIVDLGQNFAGWARLRVRGEAGTRIDLGFAEALHPDGTLDPRSTAIYQADAYICRGDGLETWEPRFTYHGFRYVELKGLPEPPDLETVTGVVVHSGLEPAGTFSCSDPMLNRIHETALWTLRSNLHGVPTDNPHRERCGWLGDAHVMAEAIVYNFDSALFWTKYVRDIETSLIGGVAPTYVAPGRGNPGPASADWASALIQLPAYCYRYYGDVAVLETHYGHCARWLEEVREKWLDADLLHQAVGWNEGLGDWLPPGGNDAIDTPVPLTSTAYVYLDHVLMAEMARALDKPKDAAFYDAFAARQRAGFNAAFYDRANHTYGSQTGNALALRFGLVPEGEAESVARRLAEDIRVKAGGRATTGILGSRYLLGELSRYGHGDVALELLRREDFPSIGWLFKLGATTLWEHWAEGVKPGGPLPERSEGSLNQAMRAGFDAWFYEGLCGIQPDPEQPGFKHFYVRPSHAGDLAEAAASYHSPYGVIRAGWKRDAGEGVLEVAVPPNTTATLEPPGAQLETLAVNGAPPAEAEGVLEALVEMGRLRVTSGTYRLTYALR